MRLYALIIVTTHLIQCRDSSEFQSGGISFSDNKNGKQEGLVEKETREICAPNSNSNSDLGSARAATVGNYCYANDENPYVNFATRTGYRWNLNNDTSDITPEGCEAKQIWLMTRHGARNPPARTLLRLYEELPVLRSAVLRNHREGRGNLCKKDQQNLAEWRLRANITKDKYLVRQGYHELKNLARRYRIRLQGLLEKPYNNGSFTFQFTNTERTCSSAKAFTEGLFGKGATGNVHFIRSGYPDQLLRFYKDCDKWKKEVDNNPATAYEKRLYEESEEFAAMVKRVSDRLGFRTRLSLSDVNLVYTMCRYDKAWWPKNISPWCAAFSRQDLEILEYREDLDYYWEDGYGFEINYAQACPPIKDIVDHFNQVIEEKPNQPGGIFYFTHSGALVKVLARMGLFHDEKQLLHSNRHAMRNRRWKTSSMDCVASNLALVLFQCGRSYKIGTFFQERLIQLPGCGTELCPFEEFIAKFGPIGENCDLNQICHL